MNKKLEIKNNPNKSSLLNFTEAIAGKKYTQRFIREKFNKLVNKSDYFRGDKMDILQHLYSISKPIRDIQKNTQDEGGFGGKMGHRCP